MCHHHAGWTLKLFSYIWNKHHSLHRSSTACTAWHSAGTETECFSHGVWHTEGPSWRNLDFPLLCRHPRSACAVHAGAGSLSGGEVQNGESVTHRSFFFFLLWTLLAFCVITFNRGSCLCLYKYNRCCYCRWTCQFPLTVNR